MYRITSTRKSKINERGRNKSGVVRKIFKQKISGERGLEGWLFGALE